MKYLKENFKKAIKKLIALMGATSVGRYFYAQIICAAMDRAQQVHYSGFNLIFSTPNALNKFRADTFSTKEPETLEWIDRIPKGSIVWDIGANVGLYSCYAAVARACQVFAFEPSVFNLELLARNIYLNGVTDRVTIVPLPLSNEMAFSKLNMTTIEWGGALSTFDKTYTHDGQTMHKVFEFKTLGLSMEDAVGLLKIPSPDYIKMDVDGIEHLILQGGQTVLRQVQGVLIEVNDEFVEQAQSCAKQLKMAGLTLAEKRQSHMVEAGAFRSAFNQIWTRTHN